MSAILSADDLNDFIKPGVACIKPVEPLPDRTEPAQVERDGETAAPPISISLTDCLACAGCVTSAEAVLVGLQSHSEVLSVLDARPALAPTADGRWRGTAFVASVSPQTRASLAAACGGRVSERQAGYMLDRLLRGPEGLASGGRLGNGFAWVVDTNAAREACLVLSADEALRDCPAATAASAASSASILAAPAAPALSLPRPVLASSCPGWVCYAEKTHPHVLPHLSRVKSPQALTGTLLKTVLSRRLGLPPRRIWHLAVMPCYDKKLEASRAELTDAAWARGPRDRRDDLDDDNGDYDDDTPVRDVDCVITTNEVLQLAAARGLDFFAMARMPLPPVSSLRFPDPVLEKFLFPPRQPHRSTVAAGTSGGTVYFILQAVSARHPGSQIVATRGRNVDVVDYTVVTGDGRTVFRAARYYGFRNIQNLIRRLRSPRPSRIPGGRMVGGRGGGRMGTGAGAGPESEYGYVEVMACPGGCTNGGGQINPDNPAVSDRIGRSASAGLHQADEQKSWLAAVDEAYYSADDDSEPGSNVGPSEGDGEQWTGFVRQMLAHWSQLVGQGMESLVMTTFREVVSDVGKGQTSDAQRVAQLAKIGGGW